MLRQLLNRYGMIVLGQRWMRSCRGWWMLATNVSRNCDGSMRMRTRPSCGCAVISRASEESYMSQWCSRFVHFCPWMCGKSSEVWEFMNRGTQPACVNVSLYRGVQTFLWINTEYGHYVSQGYRFWYQSKASIQLRSVNDTNVIASGTISKLYQSTGWIRQLVFSISAKKKGSSLVCVVQLSLIPISS